MTSIQDRVAQAVTPELIAAFREEGAVCIKGIFSPDEVALRAGIDANLAHPSERAKSRAGPTIQAGSSRISATGSTTTRIATSSCARRRRRSPPR